MGDDELVMRIRSGDRVAWDELVDRHSALLWRLARSIVADDQAASDAMQTAWLRLLEQIDRIEDPQAVSSWLCTTVRREAIAIGKASVRQAPADHTSWSFDTATVPESDPGNHVVQADQHATVLGVFRQLSDRCQHLLTLLAHKLSYKEISLAMDLPVGSIGPTKNRCLDQLRRSPVIVQMEAAL